VICGLSCGFAGRGSERLLDRGGPALTVADPCIWHGCGTNPQPTTVSHDGGCADRPGTRMPCRTRTGLSNAVGSGIPDCLGQVWIGKLDSVLW
jgi:hypothetical protein